MNTMKYKLLLLFLFLNASLSAQVAVRGFQFRPIGEYGMVLSKAAGVEVMYMGDFSEDPFRARLGLSFTAPSPRLDTFPIYGTTNVNGPEEVYEGYQIYHSYKAIMLDIGIDFAFVDKDPFYAYGGLAIQVGNNSQEVETYIYNMTRLTSSEPHGMFGFGYCLGIEYKLSESFSLFGEFTHIWGYTEEDGWLKHNEIGLGIHYTFQ